MMGHENITTTEIYTHVDTKHLSKVLEKNIIQDQKISH